MGFFTEYLAAKATISIGNAVTDAVSGAINSAVQNKDKTDVLKSLVFVVSYKGALNKEYKKEIVNVMKIMDESISLFTYEPEIDAVYKTFQTHLNAEAFFEDVLSTRFDREKIIFMYMYVLILVRILNQKNMFSPQQLYNLSLIKKQFNFSRNELGMCYSGLAQLVDSDTDDIAEELETITGDEAITHLLKTYPDLIELDKDAETLYLERYPELNKEVFEKIKCLYVDSVRKSNDVDFSSAVNLVVNDKFRIQNAINKYAKNAINEIPILFYDSSLLSNGKTGLVLTDKNVYIGEVLNHHTVPLRNIVRIISKEDTFSINDITLSGVSFNNATSQLFTDLLKNIIKLLIEDKKEAVIEDSSNSTIKQIEEIYYDSVKRINDVNFSSKVILPDAYPSITQMAVETYAKDCVGENAILLFTNEYTPTGNCGFLLTNKKLYMYTGTIFDKPKSVPLKNIVSMECKPEKFDILINNIKIIASFLYKPEVVQELFDLLQKIIPLAIEVE